MVPDLVNMRVTRFDATGRVLESMPLNTAGWRPLEWSRSPDRALYEEGVSVERPRGGLPSATPFVTRSDAAFARSDDRVELPPIPQVVGGAFRAFAPRPRWAVLGGERVAVAVTTEYSIRIHDDTGALRTIVRLTVEGREVTASDREFVATALRARITGGVPESMAEQMVNALIVEDAWPELNTILGGPDGTLWVQLVDPDLARQTADWVELLRGALPGRTFEVFDSTGVLLGHVETPAGFEAVRFAGDDLYGVHVAERGVERVMRLELVRP